MSFKKGVSGNPAGRTPGSTPGAKLKQAIINDMPDILSALIEQAKQGDVAAAKVLIDKVIPNLKSQALPVTIPRGGTLAASGDNILSAVLTGNIPPDIANLLLSGLVNQARLVEVTELMARLEKLENA